MLFGLRFHSNRSLAIISGPLPLVQRCRLQDYIAPEKMTRSTPLINTESSISHLVLALAVWAASSIPHFR